MADDRQIADELREWADDKYMTGSEWNVALRDIANRIDEEHEKALVAAHFEPSPSTPDENLAKAGLVRLPVDADGRPWHVGDVAQSDYGDWKVLSIDLRRDGWWLRLEGLCMPAESCRHHKPTPAERIRAWVDDFDEHSVAPLTVEARNRLLAIADELEGGEG